MKWTKKETEERRAKKTMPGRRAEGDEEKEE
jgi:hypothetical protein